ncbi:hypothetical protein [Sphingomicrobium nitratireducens]|uniref:hypothetical protein n=1 Tax=Sphingomicrobium nitratireducens TaxID=2964666 RepID=UPI00223EEDFC|nr:hypothetical protein [Sphingomicrobium nitratireducens]
MEILHLCDRSDRGTLFEDLRVIDVRSDDDLVACRSLNSPAWKRIFVAAPKPRHLKSDGSPDRRYREWWNQEDFKIWPLINFNERMLRLAEEGDMTSPDHEWVDTSFRPAFYREGAVRLLDWPVLPVYRAGGFEGFLRNVVDIGEATSSVLKEVHLELGSAG